VTGSSHGVDTTLAVVEENLTFKLEVTASRGAEKRFDTAEAA
jgi:hypothetical protein